MSAGKRAPAAAEIFGPDLSYLTDDTPRTFEQLSEGCYSLTVPALGIQFVVDRVRRNRHELVGELAVACDLAGARTVDGLLSVADFNVSSLQARRTRGQDLLARSRAKDIDWQGLLEEVCQRVLTAERTGQPAVVLADLAPRQADAEHTILGFRLPRNQPSCVFGDGGTGKSLIALYVAGVLQQDGESVLYADWETDEGTQRQRLTQMFPAGLIPRVRYAACHRPLVYEADRLRHLVSAHDITYLVLDSVGYACDGPPEAAESALAYFRALRRLGVGSLSLAHISRGEQGDQRPFGSVFWANSFRSTWFAKRAEGTEGRLVTVGLFHRKSNTTAQYPAVGIEFEIDPDVIQVSSVQVADVDELAPSLPLWQRMREAVRRRPQTLATLAEDLEAKVETIDRYVRRHSAVFTKVSGSDGVTRIALVDRRES